MKALIRWGKFNLVGAMGMGLQLGSLAVLNGWMPGHYLCASAAAVELAVLHNFLWHVRYTWTDRCGGADGLRPFVRFQLSNGLVSLVGNVVIMWLLVQKMQLPLVVSNLVAIVCCSLVNFCLGDRWVFAELH